ncbi:hypothetical protein J2T13_000127 [Paenibacillus sp. DS2015]|uniref:hypothetical protein n=1 Tax=Paenibacillus sp. DS2015 TaxID=3373917 RepID=UPI003D22DBAC
MDKAVFALKIAIRVIALVLLGNYFIKIATGYEDYLNVATQSEGLQVLADQGSYLVYYVVTGVRALIVGLIWIALEVALKGVKDDEDVDVGIAGTVVTTTDLKT